MSSTLPSATAAIADDADDEAEEALPPLKSIWDCGKILKTRDPVTNRAKMKCDHCGMEVARNATKMLFHVAKMKGGDIKICKGNHSLVYRKLYNDLFDKHMSKLESKSAHKRQVDCYCYYCYCYYSQHIVRVLNSLYPPSQGKQSTTSPSSRYPLLNPTHQYNR